MPLSLFQSVFAGCHPLYWLYQSYTRKSINNHSESLLRCSVLLLWLESNVKIFSVAHQLNSQKTTGNHVFVSQQFPTKHSTSRKVWNKNLHGSLPQYLRISVKCFECERTVNLISLQTDIVFTFWSQGTSGTCTVYVAIIQTTTSLRWFNKGLGDL